MWASMVCGSGFGADLPRSSADGFLVIICFSFESVPPERH
jgi:hypothetical protein